MGGVRPGQEGQVSSVGLVHDQGNPMRVAFACDGSHVAAAAVVSG